MSWDQRPSSEIQMGNGTLLATFDSCGELEQFFAPNIDALASRLGAFQTQVVLPAGNGSSSNGTPELIPIRHDLFDIRLRLETGCQVLQAEYHHRYRPLKLKRKIAIHP